MQIRTKKQKNKTQKIKHFYPPYKRLNIRYGVFVAHGHMTSTAAEWLRLKEKSQSGSSGLHWKGASPTTVELGLNLKFSILKRLNFFVWAPVSS